jgi:hypothetical protein
LTLALVAGTAWKVVLPTLPIFRGKVCKIGIQSIYMYRHVLFPLFMGEWGLKITAHLNTVQAHRIRINIKTVNHHENAVTVRLS